MAAPAKKPYFKNVQCGGGSDWRGTNYSRGPSNYPDNGWYNGQKMFKQFSKHGEYIPNSQLAYSATPLSAGVLEQKSPVKSSISGWSNSFSKF